MTGLCFGFILMSYSPDHGQHMSLGAGLEPELAGVDIGSLFGMHGSKMIEDMNIVHFFGTI